MAGSVDRAKILEKDLRKLIELVLKNDSSAQDYAGCLLKILNEHLPDIPSESVQPYVVDGVIYNDNQGVAKWMINQVERESDLIEGPFEALGLLHDNKIAAGIIFSRFHKSGSDKNDSEIEMDVVMDDALPKHPGVFRAALRQLFSFPFIQLGCRSVVAQIHEDNHKSLRMAEQAGFKRAGYLRGSKRIIFDLTIDECVYLDHDKEAA